MEIACGIQLEEPLASLNVVNFRGRRKCGRRGADKTYEQAYRHIEVCGGGTRNIKQ